MSESVNSGAHPRVHPTLRSTNLLYLLVMVLVIVVGSVMQTLDFGWGLIGTQVLLFMLPAWLFVRARGLPPRETMRLRGLPFGLALLSIGIGASIWFFAVSLEGVMSLLFGYTVMGSPDMYPTTTGQAVLLFVALAIAAPLGEELLFRGVIQRGYERLGPRRAVILAGLLFAFFHLRLSGLVALLPISLALGYVVWRSNSLLAGILMHAANNTLAALFLILYSFRPELLEGDAAVMLPLAALGGLLALLGLWLFRRLTQPEALAVQPESRSFLGRFWPLAAALLLYLVMGGVEFIVGRHPGVLAMGQPVSFDAPPWETSTTWRYELRNVVDDPVGEAECTVTPGQEQVTLTCQARQEAFEIEVEGSFWSSDDAEWLTTSVWMADSLLLLNAQGIRESEILAFSYRVETADEDLRLTGEVQGASDELIIPPLALAGYEWPWRLAGLPFSLGYSRDVTVAWPLRWRPETQDSGPYAEETALVVRGGTPIHTPWGSAIAWMVTVGEQTAWYHADAPHHLLRYDDGFHTWLLVEVVEE